MLTSLVGLPLIIPCGISQNAAQIPLALGRSTFASKYPKCVYRVDCAHIELAVLFLYGAKHEIAVFRECLVFIPVAASADFVVYVPNASVEFAVEIVVKQHFRFVFVVATDEERTRKSKHKHKKHCKNDFFVHNNPRFIFLRFYIIEKFAQSQIGIQNDR